MALKLSFDLGEEAQRLEHAVEAANAKGTRTLDLIQDKTQPASSTSQVGDAILMALDETE